MDTRTRQGVIKLIDYLEHATYNRFMQGDARQLMFTF